MDFSLLTPNPAFSLEPYFDAIVTEFNGVGITVSIKEKDKKEKTNIESAFLKSETVWKELVFEGIVPQSQVTIHSTIKIKIQVDSNPPPGFATEEKLLIHPFSFYVKCFALSSLFAGKMHALLFRKWKKRVKGRDGYDLEWHIKKGVPLNLGHFLLRARDSGDWHAATITQQELLTLLKEKIESVSFNNIKEDIVRFIKDNTALEIWSATYFTDLANRLTFE